MPIIFMSGVSSEVEVVQAYKTGGHAFLLKPVDIDELLDTIAAALTLSGSRQQEQTEVAALKSLVVQLTDRERAVIRLVLEGLTNPQIGERLHIALRTVKVHRQHAMEKLGVSNLVELTRLAERGDI
jgi:two-component system response regulator DctR